ncbi:MAG: M20/M25/M40 family metallo-hydrolase [Fluviicola sp.]|nr:M20/M25/M40 family metallo-hydrolase [Fluviicola sp.]
MKKLLYSLVLIAFPFVVSAQNPTIQAIINAVNVDSLMQNANEISGEVSIVVNGVTDTIKSRNRNRPGNELCFQYLRDKLFTWGYQIDSLEFGASGGKNIWAIKPGIVYPNEPVIICAHYDGMPNLAVAPAADDDASGMSAVLEAARTMASSYFEHTVIFAFWDDEEYGLAGSNAFATMYDTANDSIYGVINMDAIAWDSDNDSVARVHTRPTANSEMIADTVIAVNTDYNIGIDLLVNNPGATYSDHASFWNHNYGAVLLIEDWDNDANTHYHSATDEVQYFNIPYFHKMSRLSIGSAAALAVPYNPVAGLEAETGNAINIYPNPSHEMVNISWQNEYETLELTDVLGKIVYSTTLNKSEKESMLDLTGYRNGVYFVKLVNQDHQVIQRLIRK